MLFWRSLLKCLLSFTLTFLLWFLVNFCDSDWVIQKLWAVVSGHSVTICVGYLSSFLLSCDNLVENTYVFRYQMYLWIPLCQTVLFRLLKTWIRQPYLPHVCWVLFSSVSLCWLSPAFNHFHETETWGQMWWKVQKPLGLLLLPSVQ